MHTNRLRARVDQESTYYNLLQQFSSILYVVVDTWFKMSEIKLVWCHEQTISLYSYFAWYGICFLHYPTGPTRRGRNRENPCLVGYRVGTSAEVSTRSKSGLSDAHWQNDLKLSGNMPVGNTKIFTTSHSTYIQPWCFLFLDSVTVAGAVGWFCNGSKSN